MAELQSVGFDLNQPAVQAEDGATFMVGTPYLEDYLNNFFQDLQAINDESSGALTSVANIGAGEGVFAQLSGQEAQLKSLIGGAGITISADADEITIEGIGGAAIQAGTEPNTLTVWDNTAMEWVEVPELKLTWAAGVATFTVEDSLGTDVSGLTIDGDGQTGLFFDNTEVANTRAAGNGGLFVNNLATGAGFERVLTTSDAAAVDDGTVEDSILHWNNVSGRWEPLDELTLNVAANVLTVRVEDAAAVLQPVLSADADGEWLAYFDGTAFIGSDEQGGGQGLEIYDTTGGNDPAMRLVYSRGGTYVAQLQSFANDLYLENRVVGGDFRIRASASSAADSVVMFYDTSAGALDLNFDDSLAIRTTNIGAEIHSTAVDNQVLRFFQTDNTTRNGFLRFHSVDGFDVECEVHGAAVRLVAEDAGGIDQTGFEFDPDTGAAFNGGTPTAPQNYTVTNVTTDRAYDANSTTLDEIADVLGTLIADLTTVGLLA